MFKFLTRFSTYTLLVALAISVVAEFYSIAGLTAIFAAAVIPTIIMGVVLGLGKLCATVWLKLNWERAPFTYKMYLIPAIMVLMFLTSMGIFGFLSKAHSDQSLVTGDVQAKIAIYDEKIKTSKENIESNRKALKQMDEAVDQVMSRSDSEKGAEKSANIRKGQSKERTRLQSEITSEQTAIAKLSEERAPIAAEVRKVEAEVGPIKYIAALIYGDNPDSNLLESAVRWVIIIIVAVFDPLALVLLLAAQQSMKWERRDEEEKEHKESEHIQPIIEPTPEPTPTPTPEALPESVAQEEVQKAPEVNEFFERLQTVARELDNEQWRQMVEESNNKITEDEAEEYWQTKDNELIVDVESIDESIACYKCGTTLMNAPGIGPFCPNAQCDVADGPFLEEPLKIEINWPPVAVVEEVPELTPVKTFNQYRLNTTIKPMVLNMPAAVEPESVYREPSVNDDITVDSDLTIDSTIDSVETENVTQEKVMYVPTDGHLTFEGKRMSFENLKSIRPDLVWTGNGDIPTKTEFGNEFPKQSLIGDTYIRVDIVPHRVYKFNGKKWMYVDKDYNTTYLTHLPYLQLLIRAIEDNKYDPDLLTAAEQDEIEAYLAKKK